MSNAGIRFEVSMVGESSPIVCVRAANLDEAERVAAEDLGVSASRVIAARVINAARKAGRFSGAK